MASKKTIFNESEKVAEPVVDQGGKISAVRATFYIDPSIAEKVRDVAWWERTTIGEVIHDSIVEYISGLEKKRGEPYPRRHRELGRGRPRLDRSS